MMPPMDKPMDSKPPMDKENSVKCPSCGAELVVEAKDADLKEDKPMGMPKPPMPGERADKMPMDKLKNVLMSAKKPEPQGY